MIGACESVRMTTTNIDHLTKRIEQVVQEHIAASRRAAEDAVARAFAVAGGKPRRVSPAAAQAVGGTRRTRTELATLSERLYQAVCARPGESMATLASALGAAARELHRPMAHLKRTGRVRSVGERHLTRYFPLAERGAKSA